MEASDSVYNLLIRSDFVCIASKFWCSSDRHNGTLLASFQYWARSSSFENLKAGLQTSVQPVEPQKRVKSGRNASFLPDFQFIFDLTVLRSNRTLLFDPKPVLTKKIFRTKPNTLYFESLLFHGHWKAYQFARRDLNVLRGKKYDGIAMLSRMWLR